MGRLHRSNDPQSLGTTTLITSVPLTCLTVNTSLSILLQVIKWGPRQIYNCRFIVPFPRLTNPSRSWRSFGWSTSSLESCSTPMDILRPYMLQWIIWSSGSNINDFDYFGVSTCSEIINHPMLFLSLAYCGTHNVLWLRLKLVIFLIDNPHLFLKSLPSKFTYSGDLDTTIYD
jgi:hypothetical protein